jgi:hypothetical protein
VRPRRDDILAKQIVFCADGTWNGPSDDATTTDIDGTAQTDTAVRDGDTNVVKLFENLQGQEAGTQALENETELMQHDAAGALVQAAKYIHGVGDTANPIMKVLGGVLGAGVVALWPKAF